MKIESFRARADKIRNGCLGLAIVIASGCAGMAPPAAPSPAEIPALEADLAVRPTDAGLMVRLGAAYRADGRDDEAARLFASALAVDPEHAGATLQAGLMHEDAGEYTEARELYQRYLALGVSSDMRDRIEGRIALVRREELRAAAQTALSREQQLADTSPQPRTVAVFPFSYVGQAEELQPLGRAMAEMLTTDLAQTDRLTVLERLQVQMLLDEMTLGIGGLVDPETAARTGRMLGAERVVQGAIGGDSLSLELEAAVVKIGADAGTAPLLTTSDALDQLFELEKRLALQIYASAGIELTPAEWQRVSQRPTENIQALLAYGLGLQSADAGNFAQAVEHFNNAVSIDPSFTVAREGANQAAQVAAAGQVTPAQLAGEAMVETAPETDLEFASVEAMIPDVVQRDPASESLGQEGFGQRSAILEIIIRRP
jgi:tetratricopeptide (TPR) repeat protein